MNILVKKNLKEHISQMNLNEKLTRLGSFWVIEVLTNLIFDEQKAVAKLSYGIGQITRLGGATNFEAQQSAETANRIQKFIIENTRLGIPAMIHEECCSGYEIVDLGVDISPDQFVEAVQSDTFNVVALSALLSTTVSSMEATIQAFHAVGIRDQIKIIVGGAPVTDEFTKKIGADGYAPDASQAVKITNALFDL
jgi:hypothetical protein